jgi:hypothetical protein
MSPSKIIASLVTISILSIVAIGSSPTAASAQMNNGLNLQTGGNGEGNNGCGNGNGGPSGDKDCSKNPKDSKNVQDQSDQTVSRTDSLNTLSITSSGSSSQTLSTSSSSAPRQLPMPPMLLGVVILGGVVIAHRCKVAS